MIDKRAGALWYAKTNFWDGGVSNAETIGYDPPKSLLQIAIYGELFASNVVISNL